MLGTFGFFALLTVIGLLFSFLVEGRGQRPLPERLAEAPLMGVALLGSALVMMLVLFDHFAIEVVAWLPLGLAGLLFLRRRSGHGRIDPVVSAAVRSPTWMTGDFLFLITALGVTWSLMVTAHTGGVAGDYLGIWSFKALVLSEHGSLRIPDFTDGTRYHYHQAYPLLFPSLQALLYRFTGGVTDLTAKLIHPLLLCATSLLLYFRMRRRGGSTSAWAGGGICLSLPFFMGDTLGGISTGYLDIPLGCFILVAHLAALDWMEDGRLAPALRAGLFLTAAALTKNEGVVAAGVTVFLLTVFTWRSGFSRRGKGLLCVLLPLLLIGGTWYVFRRSLPTGAQDYVHSIFGPAFWKKAQYLPKVVGGFLLEGVFFERWGFLWILCLATFLTWFRGNRWVAGVFVCVMFVVYVLALTFSALEIDYQVDSTLYRLMAQLAPLAAALVAMALGRDRPKSRS
jgi:hypothetical protein